MAIKKQEEGNVKTFDDLNELKESEQSRLTSKYKKMEKPLKKIITERNPKAKVFKIRANKHKKFDEEKAEDINDSISNTEEFVDKAEKLTKEIAVEAKQLNSTSKKDEDVANTLATKGIDTSPLVSENNESYKQFIDVKNKSDQTRNFRKERFDGIQAGEFEKRVKSLPGENGRNRNNLINNSNKMFSRNKRRFATARKFNDYKLAFFDRLAKQFEVEYPFDIKQKDNGERFDVKLDFLYKIEKFRDIPTTPDEYYVTLKEVIKKNIKQLEENPDDVAFTNIMGCFTWNTGDKTWYYKNSDGKFVLVDDSKELIAKEIKSLKRMLSYIDEFKQVDKEMTQLISTVSHAAAVLPGNTFVVNPNDVIKSIEDIPSILNMKLGELFNRKSTKLIGAAAQPTVLARNSKGIDGTGTSSWDQESDFGLAAEANIALLHATLRLDREDTSSDTKAIFLGMAKMKKLASDFKNVYKAGSDWVLPEVLKSSEANTLDTYLIYSVGTETELNTIGLFNNFNSRDDSMFGLTIERVIGEDKLHFILIKVEHGVNTLSNQFTYSGYSTGSGIKGLLDTCWEKLENLIPSIDKLRIDGPAPKFTKQTVLDNISMFVLTAGFNHNLNTINHAEGMIDGYIDTIVAALMDHDPGDLDVSYGSIAQLVTDNSDIVNIFDKLFVIPGSEESKKTWVQTILKEKLASSAGKPHDITDQKEMVKTKAKNATKVLTKLPSGLKWFFRNMTEISASEFSENFDDIEYHGPTALQVLLGDIRTVGVLQDDNTVKKISTSLDKKYLAKVDVHTDSFAKTFIHTRNRNETLLPLDPEDKNELAFTRVTYNRMTSHVDVLDNENMRLLDIHTLMNMAVWTTNSAANTVHLLKDDAETGVVDAILDADVSALVLSKIVFEYIKTTLMALKPMLLHAMMGTITYNASSDIGAAKQIAKGFKMMLVARENFNLFGDDRKTSLSVKSSQRDLEEFLNRTMEDYITEGSSSNLEVEAAVNYDILLKEYQAVADDIHGYTNMSGSTSNITDRYLKNENIINENKLIVYNANDDYDLSDFTVATSVKADIKTALIGVRSNHSLVISDTNRMVKIKAGEAFKWKLLDDITGTKLLAGKNLATGVKSSKFKQSMKTRLHYLKPSKLILQEDSITTNGVETSRGIYGVSSTSKTQFKAMKDHTLSMKNLLDLDLKYNSTFLFGKEYLENTILPEKYAVYKGALKGKVQLINPPEESIKNFSMESTVELIARDWSDLSDGEIVKNDNKISAYQGFVTLS